MKKELSEQLTEENPDALFVNGFEEAFLGISRRFGGELLAAYDYEKCLEVLMVRDKMTRDDAIEFFDYNVIGAWMGPNTPVFVET